MQVKFKKTNPNAVIPTKAHPTDAGFDLTAAVFITKKQGLWEYDTGIAVEIPEGYVGLVFPRSSVSKTGGSLANSVGVIDSNYRGSIILKYYGDVPPYIYGERVGQLIILPYPDIEFKEVGELSESDRGEGGFGSTGK